MNRNRLVELRAAISDLSRPLARVGPVLLEVFASHADEDSRIALNRLLNGDTSAEGSVTRDSIAALESGIETSTRLLGQENARPETRSRWTIERRTFENELYARRERLLALVAALETRQVSRARAIPPLPIQVLDDDQVNNSWYACPNDADVAFVFVHGILSNGKTCWMNDEDVEKPVFWPDLVLDDGRLEGPAVFLGGFYTAVDSGLYDIRDAARELADALRREDSQQRPAVMSFRNIVFVCHSTGGIVVRYLLTRETNRFKDKNLGLVLIASPSFGSYLADKLRLLTWLFAQKMGKQLRWGNESLDDLDDRFKSLVGNSEIPNLVGVEACENHFVVHRKYWRDRRVVVEKESAARYFPEPRRLRDTDHFSCVKPSSQNHPAHELLLDFYVHKFLPLVRANS